MADAVVDFDYGTRTSTRKYLRSGTVSNLQGLIYHLTFHAVVRLHEFSLLSLIDKDADTSGSWICSFQPD